MKLIVILSLLATLFFVESRNTIISTKAAVTLVGGVIKSKHSDESDKKYKRKDCPVCKGQGWYWSGDKIKKIECLYCEPETSSLDCHTNIKKDK